MTLTTEQKSMLSSNLSHIQMRFNEFKTMRSYLALYFTQSNKPYITFSNVSTFPNPIQIGKNTSPLVCVYNTANDFTTQTNAFLST
jgi:hypothetical protein